MPDRESFFDNFFDAYEEAKRRRAELAEFGMSVRIEDSPYDDGYRVRSIPIAALLMGYGLGSSNSSRWGRTDKYDVGGRKKRYL